DPPGRYRYLLDGMRSYSGPRYSVSDFFNHLTSIGILHGRLSFPVNLIFELTTACNLRCTHCYVSAGEPLPNELETDEWVELIRSAAPHALRLVLTGGEPLVHPGLLDVLAEAKKHRLAVRILTNGTLLADRLPELSGLLDPRVDSFQVSLDGTEEVHDSIRGDGTFRKAMEGIRAAISRGYPVDVAFTVTPGNRSSALPLYRSLKGLGVRSFRVSWGVPVGRLSHPVTFQSFLDLVEALRHASGSVGIPVSYEPRSDLPVVPPSVYTCPAGVSQVFVASSGDVYPCPLFRFPEFNMGNVRSEDLLSIWEKPGWERLRRDLSGTKCASCPLFRSCRGGCPARAYLVSGTLNAPAPDCRWEDGVHER
ncbi:TPA: radical SAM protein, partial [Candidatus Micrarchaeota archaeon]|nr:radical SAM protein [Candidatus Micrarchaeota archaeon]